MTTTLPRAEFQADDAASLRTALAMFDDWDSDLTALFELGHDASASYGRQPKQSKTTELTAPYKQRRDAKKQEVAALRAQIEELEAVLAVEEALVKISPPASEALEAVALRKEWERMATNQQQERLASEAENASLREIVESQVETSQKILNLTRRITQLEDALPAPPVTSFEHYSGPKVDFQDQLRRLDAMIPRAAGLFSSGAFAGEARECFREVHMSEVKPGVCHVGIRYEASWLLPFDIERVAGALWIQAIRPTYKQKTVAFMDIHEDADCSISQYISTPVTKNVWGSHQGQVAARRLPRDSGDGSILIVLTGTVHAYMESKMQGSADNEIWLRIESVPSSGDKQHPGPLTRVKWYRQTLMQPPAVETMAPSVLRNWIHTMVSGPTKARFERDLEWSLQAIENMLVSPKSGV